MSAPRVLFLSLVNFAGSDRVPTAMIELGAICAAVSPPGDYCALVTGLDHVFRLPANGRRSLIIACVRSTLARAVRTFEPDMVIPLDELAALLLRGLGVRRSTHESIKTLLARSLGDPQSYPVACSRRLLMDRARELGILIPSYGKNAHLPALEKEEYSCGGGGIVEVQESTKKAKSRSYLTTFRLIARQVVWRVAGFPKPVFDRSLRQSFIQGRLVVCNAAALNGRVVGMFSYAPTRVDPEPYGSSTAIEIMEDPSVEASTRRLLESMGFAGFAALDFIVDAEGRAYLIELNARCSGTSHLGKLVGRDLCAALLRLSRGNQLPAEGSTTTALSVALFPKELLATASSLAEVKKYASVHDIPYSQPAVMEAYLGNLAKRHGPIYADEIHRELKAQPELRLSDSAACDSYGLQRPQEIT